MIISGGENIASSEVERVIYELPQVREVAVDRPARRALGRKAGRGRGAGATARRWNCPTSPTTAARGSRLQGAEATDHPRQPAAQSFRQGAQARAARRTGSSRMTQSPQAASGKVDKTQPRRAQRLDQAKDIRRRHQDRRQIWLRRGLRRPHHRGSRRRAGHVLQSFRKPPGIARSIAAEDRHRHGALHPRAHRHRACGKAGNRTLQRLLRLHPRGAGISAHPQRGRIFRADRLPEASRQHRDRLCPHPPARASGRRDRRLSATRNSRPSCTC